MLGTLAGQVWVMIEHGWTKHLCYIPCVFGGTGFHMIVNKTTHP